MIIGSNTALVLEGGGLRGVFTCGVLDSFMDKGIRFPFTIGVSAEARNKGYRKRDTRMPIARFFYRKYPALQEVGKKMTEALD